LCGSDPENARFATLPDRCPRTQRGIAAQPRVLYEKRTPGRSLSRPKSPATWRSGYAAVCKFGFCGPFGYRLILRSPQITGKTWPRRIDPYCVVWPCTAQFGSKMVASCSLPVLSRRLWQPKPLALAITAPSLATKKPPISTDRGPPVLNVNARAVARSPEQMTVTCRAISERRLACKVQSGAGTFPISRLAASTILLCRLYQWLA